MKRFLTGAVGILLFIAVLVFWTPFADFVLLALILIAVWEMYDVMYRAGKKPVKWGGLLTVLLLLPGYMALGWPGIMLAMLPGTLITLGWPDNITRSFDDLSASLVPILYPLLPLIFLLLACRMEPAIGRLTLGWGAGVAFFVDSMAFYCGHLFGKHKFAPAISPKKTWEGAIGALISVMIVSVPLGFYLSGFFPQIFWYDFPLLALLCGMGGIVGDLTASVIKRTTGVKDFGNLFPGHGGALDRFDSIIFTMPITYAYVTFLLAFRG